MRDRVALTIGSIILLLILIFTEAGWQEGDHLHWIDNQDGSWSIVKEEDLTNFIKKGIM